MNGRREVFGWHAVVDWTAATPVGRVADRDHVAQFVADLVARIGMHPHGPVWIERFAEHDPAIGGYTVFQPVTTSAVTAHLVDATGDGHLDVFSCAEFDGDTVAAAVRDWFDPVAMDVRMLIRQAPRRRPRDPVMYAH